MRVLHISPSYCRRDGGPSEVLRGLLPALDELGLEVELVTTDKGLASAERRDPPVKATRVARHAGPYSVRFGLGLRRLVRDAVARADVVHIHGVDNYASLVGMRAARSSGVPFVLQPHGAWDSYHRKQGTAKKRVWRFLFSGRLERQAAAIIVSSSRESADALEQAGPSALSQLALGVDDALFTIKRGDLEQRPQVVFIGRLARKKRLDLLIRAFTIVSRSVPDVHLKIAGPLDPDLDFDPHQLVRDTGLEDSVTFLGPVDGSERATLLAESAIFVLPSDDESFGLALGEAMAAGCAVVASHNVGLAVDAAPSGAAVLCDQSHSDLATAIVGLLRDDDQLTFHRRRARSYAKETLRWRSVARRAQLIYQEAVAR